MDSDAPLRRTPPRQLRSQLVALTVIAVALFVALYPLSRSNYLLVHSLIEMSSVLVTISIFALAWGVRRFTKDRYLLVLGACQLPVALVAMLHAFAYKGVGIFPPTGANLATQLWIVWRLLEAGSFLAAAVSLRRRIDPAAAMVALAGLTALAMLSIFAWHVFPVMYVEGAGLTTTKVALEYVGMAVFAFSLWLLWRDRDRFDPIVFGLLGTSTMLFIAAGLAFTLYVDVYGILNFVGHWLTLLAYGVVYVAVVDSSLRKPYSTLFRELKRREEEEHEIADTLQSALLAMPDSVPGFDIGHAYVSATARARVGGDFWDLFMSRAGTVSFVLGDVCGKGIGATATAAMVRTTIRGFAYSGLGPAEVLARTNDAVIPQMPEDKFVTVVYGEIDVETGEIRAASAGHPDPIVYGDGVGACLYLPRNVALGLVPGFEFEEERARIAPGHCIALFTDGLLDAGPVGEGFGDERVIEHLIGECEGRPPAVAGSLLQAALDHAGGSLADDVAIVVCRYLAPGVLPA